MNLKEELKNLEGSLIVTVNDEVRDMMALLIFQEGSLNSQVEALRENRYGFYDRDSVIKLLARIEDKRLERVNFIDSIGKTLLGDDYRQFLNDYHVEFRIDTELPVIEFFKVGV